MIKNISNLINEKEVKSQCGMRKHVFNVKIVFQAFQVYFNSKTGLDI